LRTCVTVDARLSNEHSKELRIEVGRNGAQQFRKK
jgi:hypothetical protein